MSKGRTRMAAEGYYITYMGVLNQDLSQPNSFGVVHIKGGLAKYIHWSWGKEWDTLVWSAAPTQKNVDNSKNIPASEQFAQRYIYFQTHADLLTFPYINSKPGALVPSPLDME
jgi:hypothetical protein